MSLYVSGRKVSTAMRIGRFVLRNDGSPNLIRAEYEAGLPPNLLRANHPRVYIFAVNGEIKKIGGSGSRGGIRATVSFYENARSGKPGRPRFIIHELIARELQNGNEVSIYLISVPPVQAQVCGLFSCDEGEISSFYKEIEKKCLEDYKTLKGDYPEWNFQERRQPYPPDLELVFQEYHRNKMLNLGEE